MTYYRSGVKCLDLQVSGFKVVAGSTLTNLEVKSGWYRFGEYSDKAYACPRENHCLGGTNGGPNATGLCSDVSEGFLCEY